MSSIQQVREAVNEIVASGCSVLPIRADGSKAPALTEWKSLQERLPTSEELDQWFQHRTGVAVIAGKVSGNLEALEGDDKAAWQDYLDVLRGTGYQELVERLTTGWYEETPNGYRVMYRCAEIGGNTSLAKRPNPVPGKPPKTLLETRGEGGYFIVAPSSGDVHPSGKPYVRLAGGPPLIPTITPAERAALFDIARSLDETPPPAMTEPTTRTEHRVDDRWEVKPGDDLNERADLAWWREFLEAHGWTEVYERAGVSYWRRPGKDGPGISATLNYGDFGLLRVFTTATQLKQKMYRPFSAVVDLDFDGDPVAAARELHRQGYGRERPPLIVSTGAASSGDAADDGPDLSEKYREEGNRFWLRRIGRDGEKSFVPLSNFAAWIEKEIIEDDGLTEKGTLRIAGRLASGAPLPEIEVPFSQFNAMNWPIEGWGARAVLEAGQGAKDHVRAAIQLKSAQHGFTREHVYAHSGWTRLDGTWRYLHSGGALGADGNDSSVSVRLPEGLRKLALPDPPSLVDLRAATTRVLAAIFGFGPEYITAPLISSLAVAILTEIQPVPSMVHVHGETGAFKTQWLVLLMRFFGAGFEPSDLPQWNSTANALELLSFLAKDTIFPVDDFVLGGTPADRNRQKQTFARFARSAGNGAGRSRMRSDATLRGSYAPRGLVVSSGEELPPTDTGSVQARTLLVPISRGDIDKQRLSEAQTITKSGDAALVTSAFIQLVAANWDTVAESYREAHDRYRDRLAARPSWHPRTPEAIAWHLAAADVFLESLEALAALSETEAQRYKGLIWRGFLEISDRQEAEAREADPVNVFFELVRTAISSGAAHLRDRHSRPGDTGAPGSHTPHHLAGWRDRRVVTRDGETTVPEPRGIMIGWIDGESAYLDLKAVQAAISPIASANDASVSLSTRALGPLFKRRGILKSHAADRVTNALNMEGRTVRVLHISQQLIIPTGTAESEPTEPTRLHRLEEVA